MHETFPINIDGEKLVSAYATERDDVEFVVICESGNIYLLDLSSDQIRPLGKTGFPLQYSVDFFWQMASAGIQKDYLQVTPFAKYVCITQKYGEDGVVFNLENSQITKTLKRGDYNVEHCSFPIAFYSENESTYLIHGTDWNRLDITELESEKLLTDRVVDYETHSNYFDYFHSSLSVSPDSKRFSSNGWVWQPYDVITIYEIDEFLKMFESAHKSLDFARVDGYNWDRPLCWIDNTTIGISYNRNEEEQTIGNFSSEILFIDVIAGTVTNRIDFDGFALSQTGAPQGQLFYDDQHRRFIGLNRKTGLLITGEDGSRQFSNESFNLHMYSPKHGFVYRLNPEITAVEITNIP